MKARNPSTAFGLVVADELARHGVRHAVIAPGSRSAPLALAFEGNETFTVHVQIDERSAAFTALGIAAATGVPAVVTCTSGTAAANILPAVVEASIAGVPLLVMTADRPEELRGAGANQTIDQTKLYGDAVRWFCDVGTPHGFDEAPGYWRSLASRAIREAVGPDAGPVHLNVPLREPLVPDEGVSFPYDLEGRAGGAPWTSWGPEARAPAGDVLDEVAELIARHERGLIVAGAAKLVDPDPLLRLAGKAGYPIVAEPFCSLRRGPNAISTAEALLRTGFAGAHRPELILRVGKTGLSRALAAYMADVPNHVLLDAGGRWLDPERSTSLIVGGDPTATAEALALRVPERGASGWLEEWRSAERTARSTLDRIIDLAPEPSEPRVARDLAASLPAGTTLVVGASMPVRDLDAFMGPRDGLRVTGNRGANGIDGFVSTTIGHALASDGPVVGLCGDLSLLHDQNGFLIAEEAHCSFVVLNNDGGGIFSFLPPQRQASFERLFGTPHGIDLGSLAELYGCNHVRAERSSQVLEAVGSPGGITIVEVRTDRAANRALHQEIWEGVAEALAAST